MKKTMKKLLSFGLVATLLSVMCSFIEPQPVQAKSVYLVSQTFTVTYLNNSPSYKTKTDTKTFGPFDTTGKEVYVSTAVSWAQPDWSTGEITYAWSGPASSRTLTVTTKTSTKNHWYYQQETPQASSTYQRVDYSVIAYYEESSTTPTPTPTPTPAPVTYYTLGYNANGGTGAPSARSVRSGYSTTVSSVIPTRDNYNFVGWNTNADGTGVSYSPGDSIYMSYNKTLYAQWTVGGPKFSENPGSNLTFL